MVIKKNKNGVIKTVRSNDSKELKPNCYKEWTIVKQKDSKKREEGRKVRIIRGL